MANITKEKDNRARTWTFIGYPESMPENWKDILEELGVPWACSPLHDKDINPTTKEIKKAHYHFVLSFEGKKSYEQILEITSRFNGSVPQRANSIRGVVRYFAHLDNPEKAPYNVADIQSGMGFDVGDALKLSASEENAIFEVLEDFILDHRIKEYNHFFEWIRAEHSEWRHIARKGAFHFSNLIKSIRHEEEKEMANAPHT